MCCLFFSRFVLFSVRNSNAGVERLLSHSCTVQMIIKQNVSLWIMPNTFLLNQRGKCLGLFFDHCH